jgi:hypothetical protein
MFNVPSVTMNEGSRTSVTSPPFRTPKPIQVRTPSSSAGRAGIPLTIASFVITICPSAITVPTERSIPAVRITSVWPIASTPTTITCCSTSERFSAWKKRSDLNEKNAIVARRASAGPTVGAATIFWSRCSTVDRLPGGMVEVGSVVSKVVRRRLVAIVRPDQRDRDRGRAPSRPGRRSAALTTPSSWRGRRRRSWMGHRQPPFWRSD